MVDADEWDSSMPLDVEVKERQQGKQVSDVQVFGCRVNARVDDLRFPNHSS